MNRLPMATIAVLCGGVSACLYLALLLSSPGAMILVYLTQLPLFFAGLWFGVAAAVLAGFSGAAVLFAASDLLAAAIVAALNAVPVVVLVRQALLARRDTEGAVVWYPPGRLTLWVAGLGIGGIGVALLLLGGPESLQATLRDVIGRALDRLSENTLPDRDRIAATLAALIPGIAAASWMVMAVINGALAQGLLARFGLVWPAGSWASSGAGWACRGVSALTEDGSMVDVILLERGEKLGQMGQIVKVKPGFARNYLLPQKKAMRATKENMAYFETQRAQLEANNLKRKGEAQEIGAKLEGLTVVLIRQAGESGQLYGSVMARDISDAVTAAGFTVERSQLILDRPIKTLGMHRVRVMLHPEVGVTVTANVAQSREAAQLQAAGINPLAMRED